PAWRHDTRARLKLTPSRARRGRRDPEFCAGAAPCYARGLTREEALNRRGMDAGSPLSSLPFSPARRALLRLALALGLGLPCLDPAGAQDDPRKARPQTGDRFVFRGGAREGQVVTLADLPQGGPPVTTYPIDPASRIVRNDSRLNQVLLVR